MDGAQTRCAKGLKGHIHLEASFLKSSSKLSECPTINLPEYAFVGRSNVGKSSLINMLTGRKDLAKTSGRPGKTQLINHFGIHVAGSKAGTEWYLVDLPGYGYARVSKEQKATFQKLILPFVAEREKLMCVFVLLDIRHDPQPIDLDFMERLGVKSIPFVRVFTKADKLKPGALEKSIDDYNEKMLGMWEELPEYFVTSSSSGQGRDEILEFIAETNGLYP